MLDSFILGTDFGSFTISSFLVVASLLFRGGGVVPSVGHRTNGRLPIVNEGLTDLRISH